MTTAMDPFLNAHCGDSLMFPDIMDIDIKSEIDTLVGGSNDFIGLNFNDLPPLELEDVHDIKWFNGHSNHSNSSLNLDFGGEDGPTMVNPNAVMPIMMTSLSQSMRSPSPVAKESHLTFSPASGVKLQAVKQLEAEAVKQDLLKKLEVEAKKVASQPQKVVQSPVVISRKPVKASPALLTFRNALGKHGNNVALAQVATVRTATINSVAITRSPAAAAKIQVQRFVDLEGSERNYPKPAYSYSCLIAMALKNSRNGSLPVSEIYNFMCKHFPYFKSAPNGWKNSVRHNLSLNKCFEKIEKPALNGAQRKGCLWAMNPAKISKMDEEVQKWSRKDPHAIKKAMIHPEHLDALERGELKFASSYDEAAFGDSCGSDREESGESDEEHQQVQQMRRRSREDAKQAFRFLNVQPPIVKVEEEEEDEEEEDVEDEEDVEEEEDDEEEEREDLDVEVSDGFGDVDDERDLLRMEMALAQKELLQYERTLDNKRRRTFLIQQ